MPIAQPLRKYGRLKNVPLHFARHPVCIHHVGLVYVRAAVRLSTWAVSQAYPMNRPTLLEVVYAGLPIDNLSFSANWLRIDSVLSRHAATENEITLH